MDTQTELTKVMTLTPEGVELERGLGRDDPQVAHSTPVGSQVSGDDMSLHPRHI